MAVTNTPSAEVGARQYPIDNSAPMRLRWFHVTQGDAAGDASSTFDLGPLASGRVRILPGMSRLWASAYGASRLLSIGNDAYVDFDGVTQAASLTSLGSAIDVSAATNNVAFSATLPHVDFNTRQDINLRAQVTGGTIPAAATLKGFIAYQAN